MEIEKVRIGNRRFKRDRIGERWNDGDVTRTDGDRCIYAREKMKNRNICKAARKRWRCAESERSRGEGETERNERRVYTRDIESGRKIAGIW